MELLRRLLSIALMAVVGLPLFAPFFGWKSESSLPACCRRAGMHHCMAMSDSMSSMSDDHSHFASNETCPYRSATLFVAQHSDAVLPADVIFANLTAHPAVQAQTEAVWRIARDRSRHKRGPPSLLQL
jgi:hypothetical protein